MNIELPKPGLRTKILFGTFWSAGGQVAAVGLRFCIMLVLARLLSPEFFGILGMSMIVMLILRDLSDMGFGTALVQRAKIDEIDLATIFWFNLVVSLLMAVILFFSAALLAKLLKEGQLERILQSLALLLPINAFVTVPQAVLQRELKFAQLSWRDVVGELGFGLVSIPLAMLGMGVWSLIGALAAQWISRTMIICILSPYWPIFQFKWNRLRVLFGFSIWMFVSTLMARLMDNLDYFLIGRFLGATALGYYTLAFQLVIIPTQRIAGVLSGVLFPSFAKIQNQVPRLKSGFLQIFKMLILLLAPIYIFFLISADLLVPLLYSNKWLPAVPVVRLLTLASFFYSLNILNSVLNAIGKPYWRLVILAIRAVAFICLAWFFGLERGIEGIAASILIAVILSSILQISLLTNELGIQLLSLWRSVRVSLLGAFLIVLLGWWISGLLVNQLDFTKVIMLLLMTVTGYIVLVVPFYLNDLRTLIQIVGLGRNGLIDRSKRVI